MKAHRQLVSDLESGMPIHTELQKQIDRIQALEAESKSSSFKSSL